MDGEAAACAGHPLAHCKAIHFIPQRGDGTRGRIAKRHGLIEAIEGRPKGGQHTLPAHFREPV